MRYRCKIVIRIDSASLEGPKITTEKGRGGSIRVGGKVRKKKIALFSDSRAGPASYSESHAISIQNHHRNRLRGSRTAENQPKHFF